MRDHRHPGGSGGGSDTVVVDGDDSGYYYDCCSTLDAVGYTQQPYGTWGHPTDTPHLAVEFATGMRRFGDPLGKSNPAAGGANLSGIGSDSAITTQLRFLVHMSGPVYIGAEGELGGIVSAPGVTTASETQAQSAMLLGGAGVVGAMSRQGSAAFGVELAVGGRSVVYQFAGGGSNMSTSVGTGLVEPRARAEYFVTPFVGLGAVAGANILDHGDWMAGAFIAIHTRAYGND